MAAVAEALGVPLMPWQRHVADVALEVDPATGLLWYRQVGIAIPRQSGKTTLGLSVRAHRAVGFGAQNLVYTAQTRNDARAKWDDEHWPILRDSALGSLVRQRKRTGAEAFLWSTGSIDALPAPTSKAGHGKTLDLGFIDEAFAQTDDRLEQAFEPAMVTRPQPQLWVVSTAGTAESTYWRTKVQAGRRLIESGEPSRTAYFEWSAPNDSDPMDPATWWSCMPALGHTITEDVIRAVLAKQIDEHGVDGLQLFRRAHLNQWTDEFASGWHVIHEPVWRVRVDLNRLPPPPGAPVAFAVDAAYPDAESASIAAAWLRGPELVVQVVEHRPGTSWVAARLVELAERHRPCAIVLDRKGPAGRLVADLDAAGVALVHPTMDQVAHAAGQFYSAVAGDEPSLRHFGQSELDDALAAVQKRPLGDSWTWARKGAVDISPLTAATFAAWGVSVHGRAGDIPPPMSASGGRTETADLARMGF